MSKINLNIDCFDNKNFTVDTEQNSQENETIDNISNLNLLPENSSQRAFAISIIAQIIVNALNKK